MSTFKKIGLIAGRGPLPHSVVAAARQSGLDIYVAALTGFSHRDDFDVSCGQFRLGDFGKLIKTLKAEKVDAVTFAGIVTRPDFTALRPDIGAMKYLPGVIKAATRGDDALLSHITAVFEKENMTVIGPQEICASLLPSEGVLGEHSPTQTQRADAQKARDIAKSIGAMDIGQGAVVRCGLVLAVEAQEGTDIMLTRVAELSPELRGDKAGAGGVLAKMVKPGQESRTDMPTIGLITLQGAIAAGLSGIAVETGRAFIMDREKLIAMADEAGLFIIALPPKDYMGPYEP